MLITCILWMGNRTTTQGQAPSASSLPETATTGAWSRWSTIGTVAGALAGLVALVISSVALIMQMHDRQERLDLQLNAHARRVTWWISMAPRRGTADVIVQNSGTEPIRAVMVMESVPDESKPRTDPPLPTGQFYELLGTIPPCTLNTFPLDLNDPGRPMGASSFWTPR